MLLEEERTKGESQAAAAAAEQARSHTLSCHDHCCATNAPARLQERVRERHDSEQSELSSKLAEVREQLESARSALLDERSRAQEAILAERDACAKKIEAIQTESLALSTEANRREEATTAAHRCIPARCAPCQVMPECSVGLQLQMR